MSQSSLKENSDLPQYAALSTGAIVSVVLILPSLLVFAHWLCAIIPLGAMLLGFRSQRKIQQSAGALAGTNVARLGFYGGLVLAVIGLSLPLQRHLEARHIAQPIAERFFHAIRRGELQQARGMLSGEYLEGTPFEEFQWGHLFTVIKAFPADTTLKFWGIRRDYFYHGKRLLEVGFFINGKPDLPDSGESHALILRIMNDNGRWGVDAYDMKQNPWDT